MHVATFQTVSAAKQGSSSTHLLHKKHETEVGRVLQHQLANESGAVGGILCSKNTPRQDAVRKKGVHCFSMVAVCQQVDLPVSKYPKTGLSALLHLHLLLFQEPDLILHRPVLCSCATLCP